MIYEDLQAINVKFGVASEVKWANCKRYHGNAHKAYIDYLFQLIEGDLAHLHVRFAPMEQYDHSLSGDRKRVDTVSKSFFQLVVHRAARYYGNDCDIMLRFDDGDCTSSLPDFIDTINWHARMRYNYCKRDCVIHAECLNSAREPLLQLLDVTLGALASFRNGRHNRTDAHATKSYLADYAFKATKSLHVEANTPISRRAMSIWNVRPSIQVRGPRG